MFGRPAASPFAGLRQGLVLGGAALWDKAVRLLEDSKGQDELRWRRRAGRQEVVSWAKRRADREPDRRVQLWLRSRLAGASQTELAARYGYADACGVHRAAQRLEQRAAQDKALARTLAEYRRSLSIVKS